MSAVIESQALNDLLARAGAPDTDRPRWIAERMAGVTATEVRDLVIGAVREQSLIDMKLGRTPEPGDLSHIPVIRWGREREVVIAEGLRGAGIDPESRVFHGENDSRHLASPDGIGVDFDGDLVVSEIKTSGVHLERGSAAMAKKGYEHQVQWVMHVTGARRCWFVSELRIDGPDGYEAGPLSAVWIERDDVAIAELVKVADAFLAELDRQREEGAPVIDEELDTHAVNYLRGLAAEKEGRELKESAYAAIVAAGKSQESPLARITYTPEKPGDLVRVEEPDYDAAIAAAPDVHAAYVAAHTAWEDVLANHISIKSVQGKSRAASARITAGKATKEQKA